MKKYNKRLNGKTVKRPHVTTEKRFTAWPFPRLTVWHLIRLFNFKNIPMSQKNKQIWWWIFMFSFIWIGIFRFIVSLLFRIISTSGFSWDFYVIKSIINWILGLFAILSIFVWLPLWIIYLVKWYRSYNYDRHIKIKSNGLITNNIYHKDFDIKSIIKTDIEKITKHGLDKKFSPGLAVFLNIITFGMFGFLYYWIKHDYLPIIKSNDFWAARAVWFMFIPFFNIYWQFVFWLKLVNRLNLQYKLRNKKYKISKWLAITTLVLSVIPYINYIWIFIFHSIMIYQIQSAINGLVKTK